MSTTFISTANELTRDGYAFVPISSALVGDALHAYQILLRSVATQQSSWVLTRPYETEAELGIISKSGQGSDEKTFFHFAFDLLRYLKEKDIVLSKQQRACIFVINRLYQELRTLARNVASGLNEEVFGPTLCDSVNDSFRCEIPYGASVLRFLQYPAVEGQDGAREHFDRSFLTIHLGDAGGELLALIDGVWVSISPPQGNAVVFFGVKAQYVSKGAVAPLWHKAITVPGQLRQAAEMFVHIDVGTPVLNAQEFYDSYTLGHAAS